MSAASADRRRPRRRRSASAHAKWSEEQTRSREALHTKIAQRFAAGACDFAALLAVDALAGIARGFAAFIAEHRVAADTAGHDADFPAVALHARLGVALRALDSTPIRSNNKVRTAATETLHTHVTQSQLVHSLCVL